MKLKKTLRLFALIVIIALASLIPVPINLYRKDNKAKVYVEQIDEKEIDKDNEEIKVLF